MEVEKNANRWWNGVGISRVCLRVLFYFSFCEAVSMLEALIGRIVGS
jgi:hypothetical protein